MFLSRGNVVLRRFGLLVAGVISLAALFPSLYSQTDTASRTFQTKAQIVVLDVVVTGKNHRPFAGLSQQDFQVLEDGKPQVVKSFEEHDANPPGETKETALLRNMFSNTPRIRPGDAVTVLVLDSLNTPLDDQRRVRDQVLKYLKKPRIGRRLAIFTLQTQLRLIQDFTDDPVLLAAAVEGKKSGTGKQVSPLLQTNGETAVTEETAAAMREFHNADAAAQLQQFMTDQASYRSGARLKLTLQALQTLAHYLGGYSGRKNVVWFSGGFPLSIFPDPNARDPFSSMRDDEDEVRKTDALLASTQVAIYPVAAEGVITDGAYEAGADSRVATPGQLSHPQGAVEQANANHAAMSLVSRDTGGVAFFGTNDLADALDRVFSHGSHFYTLTYTSSNRENDGRFRKIEVKLARRGYQLDYRRGYYADRPGSATVQPAPVVENADLLSPYLRAGATDATEIPLTLHVVRRDLPLGKATPVSGDNSELKSAATRCGVDLMIPARGLDFQTGADGERTLHLEAGLLVYDRQGRARNWLLRQVNLHLDDARYGLIQANGLNLYFDIDVPAEAIFLRGGIYDRSSHLAGTVAVPLAAVSAIASGTH
jgi:VWFA-related protein